MIPTNKRYFNRVQLGPVTAVPSEGELFGSEAVKITSADDKSLGLYSADAAYAKAAFSGAAGGAGKAGVIFGGGTSAFDAAIYRNDAGEIVIKDDSNDIITINSAGMEVRGIISAPATTADRNIDLGRNLSNWDPTFATGYSNWSTINDATLEITTEEAYIGAYSFKIGRTSMVGGAGAAVQLGDDLKEGRKYTLSGRYICNGTGFTAGVALKFNSDTAYTSPAGSVTIAKTLTAVTEWTYFSITLEMVALTPTRHNFAWIGYDLDSISDAIYFDDLTFTEGSVPYLGYNGEWITCIDRDKYKIYGKVGINNNDPDEALDVTGNILTGVNSSIYMKNSSNTKKQVLTLSSVDDGVRLFSPDFHLFINPDVDQHTYIHTNTTGNVYYFQNKAIFKSDGKVGIGTTDPQILTEVRTVSNTTGIEYGLRVTNPANANVTGNGVGIQLKMSDAGGEENQKFCAIEAVAEDVFGNNLGINFKTWDNPSSVDAMRINYLGYLGINNDDPQYLFHLKDGGMVKEITTNADQTFTLLNSDQNKSWSLRQFASTASPSNGFAIEHFNGTATDGHLYLTTDGNLGVGIPPVSKFTIQTGEELRAFWKTTDDEAFTQLSLLTDNDRHCYIINYCDNTAGTIHGYNKAGLTVFSADPEGNVFAIGTSDGNALTFFTNSAEKVRVTSTGFVGIGEDTPTARLHVKGTTGAVKIQRTDTHVNTLNFLISGSDGLVSNSAKIYLESAGDIGFRTSNTGDFELVLKDNGNVGIGTTAPDELLEVDGNILTGINSKLYMKNSSGVKKQVLTLTSADEGVRLQSPDYHLFINPDVNQTTQINFNNTQPVIFFQNKAAIQNDGDTGIGTTTPGARLHVYSGDGQASSYITGTQLILENNGNTYLSLDALGTGVAGIAFPVGTDNDNALIDYDLTSKFMRFKVNAKRPMILENDGHLKIDMESTDLGATGLELYTHDTGAGEGLALAFSSQSRGTFAKIYGNSGASGTEGDIIFQTDGNDVLKVLNSGIVSVVNSGSVGKVRVLTVGSENCDYTSIQSAIDAAATGVNGWGAASATNPYTVYLMPGIYTVTSTITLKPFVHLKGLGCQGLEPAQSSALQKGAVMIRGGNISLTQLSGSFNGHVILEGISFDLKITANVSHQILQISDDTASVLFRKCMFSYYMSVNYFSNTHIIEILDGGTVYLENCSGNSNTPGTTDCDMVYLRSTTTGHTTRAFLTRCNFKNDGGEGALLGSDAVGPTQGPVTAYMTFCAGNELIDAYGDNSTVYYRGSYGNIVTGASATVSDSDTAIWAGFVA